jgi:uncharacterized membrane protein
MNDCVGVVVVVVVVVVVDVVNTFKILMKAVHWVNQR